jgi:hypothetical protein
MTLYKADFLEAVGVPVIKKSKGKKRAVEEVLEERPSEGGKQLPVKKPKTEKQLAALERARENRQKKKEEALLQKEAEEKAVEDAKKAVQEKEAEIEKKKLERKQKRAAKKAGNSKEGSVTSTELDKVIEEVTKVEKVDKPKVAKVKKVKDDSEPPSWFKKYIEGQHIEKNELSKEKKPAAIVKKESKEVAQNAWKDDFTRDRVNQERDNHMARMYSSIFGSKLAAR